MSKNQAHFDTSSRLGSKTIIILKCVLAVGLIVWLVVKGMLDVASLRVLIHPGSLLVSVALVFCNIGLNNARWVTLLQRLSKG